MPSRSRSRSGRTRGVLAVVVGVLAVSVPTWAARADAAGGVRLSVNPVPVAAGDSRVVTVSWTGQRPGQLIFIRVCNKPTVDPSFNDALDCSLLSEVNPNGTADGSGSAQVSVFRGPEPGGDNPWGCFLAADAAPAGIQKSTTCYVRVTNTVVSNDEDAVDAAFTLVNGPPGPAAGTSGGAGATPFTDPAVAAATTVVPGPAAISLTG